MLSWLTGSRLVDSEEYDGTVDDTRIEPPETPAPVFAVRAFKHAIFGTPQAVPQLLPARLAKKRKEVEEEEAKDTSTDQPYGDIDASKYSPTKGGILRTPGAAIGKKKEVTFGAHVVDNEGKKPSRTGLPSNYPGKFPSPWTPKATHIVNCTKDKKNLIEALCDAKVTGTNPVAITRARDDADISIDMIEPRSESGRYWKEQYTSYSQKSEGETKKLIAKQKLARDYARKKDDEATELKRQLQRQTKASMAREKQLEAQIKDLREQLRVQLGENAKSSTEMSVLRKRFDEVETFKSALEERIGKQSQLPPPLTSSGMLWTEAAGSPERDDAASITYLQTAVIQSRGEKARSQRQHKDQRLARKEGSVARQDSGTGLVARPTTERRKSEIERALTPTPKHQVSRRWALADKSPNVPSSPVNYSFFSPLEFERTMAKVGRKLPEHESLKGSTNHRKAMADAATALSTRRVNDADPLDGLASIAALSLEAQQSITPQNVQNAERASKSILTPVPSSRRHKRSEATWTIAQVKTGLDEDRDRSARERVAARRKKRDDRRTRI